MTTAAPAVLPNSIVQHLRSSRAGARPGDGTIRSLLDGEIFINQADGVFCTPAANGAMRTSYAFNSAGIAALLSATAPFTLLNAGNLGADFDQGSQVTGKLNVVAATTTTPGKMRFATATEAANATAGTVMDSAQINALFASALLGALLSKLPTTLPSTAGQAWLNGGVLEVTQP